MKRFFPGLAATLLLFLAGTASAQLVAHNAGTTSPETPVLRLQVRGSEWKYYSEYEARAEFTYGIHPRLEASLSVPIAYKDFEIGNDVVSLAGPGDASVDMKLNVLKEDGVMTSTRVAVFGGVELPTGRWKETLNGERLPRKLQLGSGTFDFSLGTAFTYIQDRHRVAIDVSGRYSSQKGGVRPGAQVQLNAAYWFRLFPASFEPGQAGTELRLVLDASAVYRERTRGEPGNDSGVRVWVSPGIQFYATTALLFEANGSLPAYDGVDDQFGHARVEWMAAVKFLF
ncbi:MAG: hypothetical protein K8T20_02425 [Planctomycetes bacterium]|nr:hypothetical protein [Planctomycetota bacterium]